MTLNKDLNFMSFHVLPYLLSEYNVMAPSPWRCSEDQMEIIQIKPSELGLDPGSLNTCKLWQSLLFNGQVWLNLNQLEGYGETGGRVVSSIGNLCRPGTSL